MLLDSVSFNHIVLKTCFCCQLLATLPLRCFTVSISFLKDHFLEITGCVTRPYAVITNWKGVESRRLHNLLFPPSGH